MLVLSRQPGETIDVARCEMTVTVVAVERKVVRPGIVATEDIDVSRDEVWRRIGATSNRPPAGPGCNTPEGDLS